ncbi:MAG: DUF2065 domain-containing protein [Rhodospirillaceae bacterium]
MDDLWTAIGLVLVIEGAIYALFPDAMKRMLETIRVMPPATLRKVGLISTFIGFGVVWLVRH